MPRTIEFLAEAVEDAEAATRWYAERSPRAALAFVSEIEHAVSEILRLPQSWPAFLRGTNRFLLRRFPYSIIYRYHDDRITVIAVAHAHRRPGFWRGRE